MISENHEEVNKAVEILKKGGIVLYPTDTVYALAVDATNREAISKLKILKGRDENKPISVVVSDIKMAELYVEVNEIGKKLAEKFLPGALTIIFEKKDNVLDELVGGERTLGIRIPNNKFCLELAQVFGKPYTATSANISNMETKNSVPEILEQFGRNVSLIDYVVDAGKLGGGKPSTIVDVHEGEIKILREGAIDSGQILEIFTKN